MCAMWIAQWTELALLAAFTRLLAVKPVTSAHPNHSCDTIQDFRTYSDKMLNILMYGSPFCVIIYANYKHLARKGGNCDALRLEAAWRRAISLSALITTTRPIPSLKSVSLSTYPLLAFLLLTPYITLSPSPVTPWPWTFAVRWVSCAQNWSKIE